MSKVVSQPSFVCKCLDIAVQGYQVGRPAMGLVASSLYLYNNENASLVMAMYFAFIYQLAANAANDYMDWERDLEEEDREFSSSRGKASSKDMCWYFYMFATCCAIVISYFDPKFGAIYFVISEFGGNLLYNGVFMGIPVHEISMVKRNGFPLDFLIGCWIYMPSPHMLGEHRWFPSLCVSAWGATMIWAQLKDYAHEKDTKVETTATTLGPLGAKLLISGSALVMMYEDIRLSLYGIYTFYSCYTYPDKKVGKMSVVMALNMFLVTCFDPKVDFEVKLYTYGAQIICAFFYYAYPNLSMAVRVKNKKA
jgi:4-hydroxybenzoate polyprenyltransferase